jgi:hypothetical protein
MESAKTFLNEKCPTFSDEIFSVLVFIVLMEIFLLKQLLLQQINTGISAERMRKHHLTLTTQLL